MEKDPRLARKLLSLIDEECDLHRRYLTVLEKERDALTKFSADAVSKLTEERATLCSAIEAAHERRREFLRALPGGDSMRLSEVVVRHCEPTDARVLAPKVASLRELVEKSRVASLELSQVLNFSLTLVNGTISILWSATQNISRLYSRRGVIREQYQPASNRSAGVLKQA